MADKQTDSDKAAAMKEYRAQHDAAVDRIAALRAARLKREAEGAAAETDKSSGNKSAGKKTVAKKAATKAPPARLAKKR